MRIASCVFCFVLGLTQFAPAAALADFNGVWVLAHGESGGLQLPGGEVQSVTQGPNPQIALRVTQNKNTLRVESRNDDPAAARILEAVKAPTGGVRELVVDGTEHGSQNSSYSAKWDGEKIVIDRHIKANTPFGPLDMTEQEVWALSADGKVLTVSRSFQNGTAEIKSTQVYNKADAQN